MSAHTASLRPVVFTHVKKRTGNIVPFESAKITAALEKAGLATEEFAQDEARRLTIRVLTLAYEVLPETPEVEQLQDLVEEVLLASPHRKTAKSYILYRDQQKRRRQMIEQADIQLIDNYLERLDWQVNENSNMAYSLQGLNNYIANETSKNYWLHRIYPPEVRDAHEQGDLHIHDLGLLSVYCVGWDLQDLLKNGFRGVAGKAASAPAKHFRSALGQVVNFFYTLQGEAAGAQAFSSFDTLLAPFIRKDGLTFKEVKQAVQEFIFNLNVPTRVGFQTPFTNLTMDLQPPSTLRDEPAKIGGVDQENCYSDYQVEMNMINEAFLEVMSEGDANARVFTFPIPTYNITEDFNWDDKSLDKLWSVTAKYGIPYFANFVNSDLSVDDARSMCCRLRLDTRELEKRGGGLFGANPLTGSIGVVTMNLVALGQQSNSEEEFFTRLDHQLEIARTSLEIKRKVLEDYTAKGLYPYTKYYLRQVHNRFQKYWENHFSTIGVIGANEACIGVVGHNIGDPEGNKFATDILDYIREKLQQFQTETGNLYNLEATPAEGTGFRLAQIDKKRFPEMKTALCTDDGSTPIYTNSTQLPINYSDDIYKILDLQDNLQTKYTGGTVQHIFLGEAAPDPVAVKAFVKSICNNYQIPYFTISPSFSICPEHGYLLGEVEKCPTCDGPTEIYSRVVGYLRPVQQWNDGKKAEFKQRSHFKVGK
ncbi:ribonucleoside triphosphate reductase [Desulfotalea psychrophila]|uniref:Related to anaerobic ribonucleoside-triphosphate reductase n=1 Tax=Desulfotalea psychrophila (strain LSv54 / DSM 12343) TaxID=177439 RepID=Q6AS82_DESPS|nr:ribonucleoside triphosphate reductase [Desulfotalea psychrophila]CAG34793.1 related to anaerobic ribonucleoside-triphosphate reductase [Desulfotalea psychrophila LSv54]